MKSEQNSNRASNNKKGKDMGSFIVMGFLFGAMIGIITNNYAPWLVIGLSIGILVGAVYSLRKKGK